ncbi:hypothetical protein [Litoreibacter roseus]|uniref:Uncharacterized protein n=1 Tax=Litoreibacter roseus TaxID=2601869 RepID=A0A6N6JF21_9RHOB|nr:hypothetical protein [Litoreibacter roseus]GFE64826.1 hypothetical protein KIN_19000 [Litoreibacter roseus]
MSFVRPEIQSAFVKYSEVLAGLVIAAVGVWTLLRSGWLVQALGGAIILIGLAISYTAWRRLNFPTHADGPGLVEVDEREVNYLSAYEGGTVSIDRLARVSAVAAQNSHHGADMVWVLEEDGGQQLVIPSSATGVDQLFDAFAALDGVDYDKANQALAAADNSTFVIWSKTREQLN